MPGVSSSNYDVTSDGQRFLMVKEQTILSKALKVVRVPNWANRLKDLSRTTHERGTCNGQLRPLISASVLGLAPLISGPPSDGAVVAQ